MRWPEEKRFRLFREQRGVSLIETVIALALLGIIGVAFLSGLSTTSRAVMISQEKVAAESLAKSQVEYIKAQDYIPLLYYDPDDPENCYKRIVDIPADLVGKYDIEIIIEIPPPETIPVSEGPFELQSITVVIKRNGERIFTMSDYRCGSSA